MTKSKGKTMKITQVGLLTLGFMTWVQADLMLATTYGKEETLKRGNLVQIQQAKFSPKIEIHNNVTTIIPKDNTMIEEKTASNPNGQNVSTYLLPKIKNGQIVVNNSTQIDFCGETTYLVSVGTNYYQHDSMELQEAVNDAKTMVKKISSNCKNTQSYLLLNKEATKENILKKVAAISKKARKKDSVIFFYSGNGFNHNHQNYMVAYDSKMNKNDSRMRSFIGTKQISSLFKPHQTKKVLMIVDACTTSIDHEYK